MKNVYTGGGGGRRRRRTTRKKEKKEEEEEEEEEEEKKQISGDLFQYLPQTVHFRSIDVSQSVGLQGVNPFAINVDDDGSDPGKSAEAEAAHAGQRQDVFGPGNTSTTLLCWIPDVIAACLSIM